MKRFQKAKVLLGLAAILGVLITGCSSKEPAKPETQAPPKAAPVARMVFIVKTIENIYWETMIRGAKEAGKDFNIEVEGFGPLKPYDVEEQIRFIENAITKKVNAIIVVPADSKGIIPGIEKANAAGIPVITPNTKALGGRVRTWIGYGNTKAAYDAGKYLLAKIEKKDPKIVILEGKPGNQITVELNQGFDQAIKDSGKNVKVLARQPANYARVDAQNVMENLLQQFKEIDGVMAANDAMALGAIEAIAAAGRLDKIKVSGNNGNADALKAMKEGKLVCTPRQLPRDQGYWGVAVAWMAMKGLDLPSEIYIDSPLITPENVEEHLKYSY